MSTIKNTKWKYLKEGMTAEAHTPIYKMHKYFARRPQNVFSALIQNYTMENDVILDPFCGGGVTVVEGSALNRRVITSDINPLATFISRCEVTTVESKNYVKVMSEILSKVEKFSNQFYCTRNRETGEVLPVRWYEHAYTVACPGCGKETALKNAQKKHVNGVEKNGWYICSHCGNEIRAVECPHIGTEFVSVTYKTTTRTTQKTVLPEAFDYQQQASAEVLYTEKIDTGEWFVPDVQIPVNWDRQQEDCLIRKGFVSFKDFFTKRSLLVNAYFLDLIKSYKEKVSENLYQLLLLTFSATIRYTNNMTISTDNWQDGRPVAWAKHAYWTSNQFVEVNPIEYIEKRVTAIKGALVFQKEKFKTPVTLVSTFDKLSTPHSSWIMNEDSSNLPIPDESVDFVLTDPPYGGNVQYGELSAFWLSWIYDELGVSIKQITELDGEILIHRKNKVNAKTYQTYYEGLRRVYSECYRVLKKGQPMVFTFNSKDAKVWIAVQKAALDAGFVLEPDGVIYQSPIENYKNTAHTKAAGTVHGDFIYTFVKPLEQQKINLCSDTSLIKQNLLETINNVVCFEMHGGKEKTISEIYIAVLRNIIPLLTSLALSEENFDFTEKVINGDIIESTIKSKCVSNGHGLWKLME
jgi:adenine-specific DNA methylase